MNGIVIKLEIIKKCIVNVCQNMYNYSGLVSEDMQSFSSAKIRTTGERKPWDISVTKTNTNSYFERKRYNVPETNLGYLYLF